MVRVLFVCLGNICRSTMAEAVFMHRVREAGLESEIEADSAGTGGWHVGEPPHPGTAQLLAAKHIPYSHSARQVTAADFAAFEYIVAMDSQNFADLMVIADDAKPRVSRMLDWSTEPGIKDVPDPFYTGGFGEVYRLIADSTGTLLAHIRSAHGL